MSILKYMISIVVIFLITGCGDGLTGRYENVSSQKKTPISSIEIVDQSSLSITKGSETTTYPYEKKKDVILFTPGQIELRMLYNEKDKTLKVMGDTFLKTKEKNKIAGSSLNLEISNIDDAYLHTNSSEGRWADSCENTKSFIEYTKLGDGKLEYVVYFSSGDGGFKKSQVWKITKLEKLSSDSVTNWDRIQIHTEGISQKTGEILKTKSITIYNTNKNQRRIIESFDELKNRPTIDNGNFLIYSENGSIEEKRPTTIQTYCPKFELPPMAPPTSAN